MANGRGDNRVKRDTGRDAGRFIGLPVSVLDCPGYSALSHTARSLLLEVARQFKGDDNGRMLLSLAYLSGRGWKSPDVIQRAKRQLLDRNFIFETVKGHRPNKASWYAVTWRKLDKLKGFDPGVERAFEQGAYKRDAPLPMLKKATTTQNESHTLTRIKNTVLIPSPVAAPPAIGTSGELEKCPPTTSDGTMRAALESPFTTSDVHPLEKPSADAGCGALNGWKTRVADEPTTSIGGDCMSSSLLAQAQRRAALIQKAG